MVRSAFARALYITYLPISGSDVHPLVPEEQPEGLKALVLHCHQQGAAPLHCHCIHLNSTTVGPCNRGLHPFIVTAFT